MLLLMLCLSYIQNHSSTKSDQIEAYKRRQNSNELPNDSTAHIVCDVTCSRTNAQFDLLETKNASPTSQAVVDTNVQLLFTSSHHHIQLINSNCSPLFSKKPSLGSSSSHYSISLTETREARMDHKAIIATSRLEINNLHYISLSFPLIYFSVSSNEGKRTPARSASAPQVGAAAPSGRPPGGIFWGVNRCLSQFASNSRPLRVL